MEIRTFNLECIRKFSNNKYLESRWSRGRSAAETTVRLFVFRILCHLDLLRIHDVNKRACIVFGYPYDITFKSK